MGLIFVKYLRHLEIDYYEGSDSLSKSKEGEDLISALDVLETVSRNKDILALKKWNIKVKNSKIKKYSIDINKKFILVFKWNKNHRKCEILDYIAK